MKRRATVKITGKTIKVWFNDNTRKWVNADNALEDYKEPELLFK